MYGWVINTSKTRSREARLCAFDLDTGECRCEGNPSMAFHALAILKFTDTLLNLERIKHPKLQISTLKVENVLT